MKKAVIYARTSSDRQKRDENIDVQIKELQDLCDRMNLTVTDTIIDDGVSSISDDRIDTLIEYIRQYGETFEILVFKNISRLTRDADVIGMLRYTCRRQKVSLLSHVDGPLSVDHNDKNGLQDQFQSYLKAMGAQEELKSIINRLVGARDFYAKRGRKATGQCPLGYQYVGNKAANKTIVVNLEEAEIVKYAFRVFLDTGSTTKTAKALNEAGYVTRRGGKFSRQGVQIILQNDFYTGILTHGGTKIKGQHEPIISKHLFTKAQRRFKA